MARSPVVLVAGRKGVGSRLRKTSLHMGKPLPQSTPDPLTSPARREWVLAALDQYEGRLLSYAQRLLGDPDQARDVVQFTFLRLCDQSPEEIDDRLAQWLYTVCRNRALDLLRGRVG